MKGPFGLYFVILIAWAVSHCATAQEDTVHWELTLTPFEVASEWINPFVAESAIRSIPLHTSDASLSDALRKEASFYLRDYGNGQLSAVSFRGTSPTQTQVLWHGIPVNSPTLGQSDLSTWPIGLMSTLSMHAGNSGSLFGSGAIGGALLINPTIPVNSHAGWHASLQQGSFGSWSGRTGAQYGKGKWGFTSRVIASTLANDFLIRSPRLRDSPRQTNASVQNIGFSQSISWQQGKQSWHAEWMHTLNDRQVQPGITALTQENTLRTQANRVALTQETHKNKWHSKTTLGWVLDETRYNDTLITPSRQYSMLHRSKWNLSDHWLLQLGGLLQHATVNSIQLSTDAQQSQVEPFSSLSWYPLPKMQLSSNHRWLIIEGKTKWIPSAMIEFYQPLGLQSIRFSASWSSGFRYPTLNDRYWIPGGNTELAPETSQQWESRLTWSKGPYELDLAVFDIRTQDQIVWLPQENNLWSPVNVRSTQNRGIEVTSRVKRQIAKIKFYSVISGSLLTAQLEKEEIPLPYVPSLRLNGNHQIGIANWRFSVHSNFTGKRYTALDGLASNSLPNFFLLDVSMGYALPDLIGKKHIRFTGTVRNITQTYYELQSNLAMPGINYQLQITIL